MSKRYGDRGFGRYGDSDEDRTEDRNYEERDTPRAYDDAGRDYGRGPDYAAAATRPRAAVTTTTAATTATGATTTRATTSRASTARVTGRASTARATTRSATGARC
jgi:hypothetical protein